MRVCVFACVFGRFMYVCGQTGSSLPSKWPRLALAQSPEFQGPCFLHLEIDLWLSARQLWNESQKLIN
jgi:hypothetical protein